MFPQQLLLQEQQRYGQQTLDRVNVSVPGVQETALLHRLSEQASIQHAYRTELLEEAHVQRP